MVVAAVNRDPTVLNGTCIQYRAPRIQRGMAVLTILVGTYGQIHDALVSQATRSSDLHIGFGAILICSVALCIRSRITSPAGRAVDDIYTARQLSRLVYVLLYTLAGLREIANIGVYLGLGGTFDLGWIAIGHSNMGAPPELPTMDTFQIYVLYGTIAIILIRVKSGALWDRAHK